MAVAGIAGAAQTIQRPDDWSDPADAKGALELRIDAARAAAADAGSSALLDAVGWIGVAGGVWRHANPGQLIARELGVADAKTALTMPSGSSPQELVGVAAEKITNGEVDVALVLGGEATWSFKRLRTLGVEPGWITDPGEGTPEMYAIFPPELGADAAKMGGTIPAYALFDDSLRASLGSSVDAHRSRIAELWARFSAVAATNPYAWDRTPHTAVEIREPTADNRMLSFPYTKAMVANNTVNMASAVLLCSVEFARARGVSTDGFVFPHAVTGTHETWAVQRRDRLHGVPAVAAGGRAALEFAGISMDDIEHIDLYACFPSIVQMSAEALGLSLDRQLTVTGGLGFAGAPLANSSGQAIAAMVPLLREGGWGFVHANGGFATKHGFGVYHQSPPSRFVREDCQDRVVDNARDALPDDWEGKGTVEAVTVNFDREGPQNVLAAILSDDGRRAWARSTDAALMEGAMAGELTGGTATRSASGALDA